MVFRGVKRRVFSMADGCLRAVAPKQVGVITRVATSQPAAALTFDDGPNPKFTPLLLEILRKHHALATFFVIGEVAQHHPGLIREMAEAGHALGNHSWSHPSFALISRRERREQIRACSKITAPHDSRLFRPPYGRLSLCARLGVARLRYEVIAWNVEVDDWWDGDSGRLTGLLVRRIQPGSIVLLHDNTGRKNSRPDLAPRTSRQPLADRTPMLQALDVCLGQIGGKINFVTIPQLLSLGRPQRCNWYFPHFAEFAS